MIVLPILIHPDPRLKKLCSPFEAVDDDARALGNAMLATMYDAPGVGLAAPQVGQLKRLFVMDCADKEEDPEPMVLVNPSVVWSSEGESTHEEGCLSIPGQYEDVTRPAEVKVSFWDLAGKEREEHFSGLWSRCAQHEIDHLNGVLFIDYLSRMKKSMITKRMQKLKKERAKA
jgi:peptide deformylase